MKIKDLVKKIRYYDNLKIELDLLQAEKEKILVDKEKQKKILNNYRCDNEFLSNLLTKKEMELKQNESRRRKCASKIGGMQTRINSLLDQNSNLKKMLIQKNEELLLERENILAATKMISEMSKEIKRIKKKPATTMENLMKYEMTRKSPKDEEVEK